MRDRLSDFEVLTFDCYGTLIDWESGIWDALQPQLMHDQCMEVTRETGLATFARHETAQEAETPDLRYPVSAVRAGQAYDSPHSNRTVPTTKRKLAMGFAKTTATAGLLLVMATPMAADHSMGFFVTSVGIGNGGDLGGVEGADAHCVKLAEAAGSTGREWRAYVSTQSPDGKARGQSARDRIGAGPWYNASGELIASDLDQLHLNPNIVKRTALDENGNLVNGRGDKPNKHDILTGSKDDGTAYFPWEEGDHTCGNWTSSTAGEGSAQVGHHDRHGGGNTSWNSAHGSRGCSQENLVGTGGAGFLYCFAAD